MAFADPQTIVFPTAGSVSLPRTSSGVNSGGFLSGSGNTKLEIAHQKTSKNRTRHTARVTFKVLNADPLVSGNNLEHQMVAYVVVDVPTAGVTTAQIKDVTDGLAAWMTASSAAQMVKLIGSEN
jgi:hypothetical protein